jgi:hypothetical protein
VKRDLIRSMEQRTLKEFEALGAGGPAIQRESTSK